MCVREKVCVTRELDAEKNENKKEKKLDEERERERVTNGGL